MTCIAGLVENGRLWMGADSALISGWDHIESGAPKVRRVGPFLIGFSGSPRQEPILQYKLNIPPHPKSMSDEEYISMTLVDEIRKCYKEYGFAKKDNEQEEGGTSLIGYKDKLWHLYADYQCGTRTVNYDAIGCGAVGAVSALYAISKTKPKLNPRKKLELALEASEYTNCGVRGPFLIKSMSCD